jgi:two-component system sensor histidine kinase LytS
LQAQINPHFLFNALNTIGYYCRKQPETAKRLIVHLGNYYRSNLAGNDSFVTLRKELQCVDDYVKIEMARFEGRLTVEYQIAPDCDAAVPPLILQPLVENAIKHGINPKPDGGTIRIIGKRQGETVQLTIEDDGVGINPELAGKLLEYDPSRKSIGLSNVNSRLVSIYGPDNGLCIESRENAGTRISLMIPQERRV